MLIKGILTAAFIIVSSGSVFSASLTVINKYNNAQVVFLEDDGSECASEKCVVASGSELENSLPSQVNKSDLRLKSTDGGDENALRLYEALVERKVERDQNVTRVSCQSAPDGGSVRITIRSSPEVSAECAGDVPDGTVSNGWDADVVVTFEPSVAGN